MGPLVLLVLVLVKQKQKSQNRLADSAYDLRAECCARRGIATKSTGEKANPTTHGAPWPARWGR